jgi:hypothetical protein
MRLCHGLLFCVKFSLDKFADIFNVNGFFNVKDLIGTLDTYPPRVVRALAIRGGAVLSTRELAAKSGLSPATIKALARADSWMGFEIRTAVLFTRAVGVDLLHMKRPSEKLKRMLSSKHGPPHLRTQQKRYWISVLTGDKNWRKTQP